MDNGLRIPLAMGIVALLAGLQTMFGLGNPLMGWVGVGIGVWLIALVVWKLITKKKPNA